MNAYLRNLPAEVVTLSARITDAVLVAAYETVDRARQESTGEPVTIPGIGTVPAANVRMVWGWLVDVVKSRHTEEWTAISDAHYAEIETAAATLQGVTVDSIDWDTVPGELFDSKPSALDIALTVLRSHSAEVRPFVYTGFECGAL